MSISFNSLLFEGITPAFNRSHLAADQAEPVTANTNNNLQIHSVEASLTRKHETNINIAAPPRAQVTRRAENSAVLVRVCCAYFTPFYEY